MLKRLLLENFMAHGRTELEFGPGLTVLTGPNNIGKSAVVEALRCLATNPTPKHYIRHGAKLARVEVELEGGYRIVWIRKPNTAYYEVYAPGADKPEVYAKFGRETPREIQELLRLPLVALDESRDPIDLHLGNQRKPIFLLDQPGSTAAAFFAASTEAAHLLAMQNLLKAKTHNAKKEKRACETQLLEVEQALARLAPLPGLELGLETASELLVGITAVSRLLPRLDAQRRALAALRDRKSRLADARVVLERLRAPDLLTPLAPLKDWLRLYTQKTLEARAASLRRATLDPLAAPPALFDARSLAEFALRISSGRRRRRHLGAYTQVLTDLAEPTPLFSAAALERALARQRELAAALASGRRRAAVCDRLEAPPSLHELGPLQALRDGLVAAQAAARLAALSRARLAALAPSPALFDPAALAQATATLQALRAKRNTLADALAAQTQELEAKAAFIAARLTAIAACPLCGGRLDFDTFLHSGCAHAISPDAD